MKQYILIAILFIACNSLAQVYDPLFTTDKEWTVRFPDATRVIRLSGDTVFNGTTYKIIASYHTGPNPGDNHLASSFVREDTLLHRCWILNQDKKSERLLYDFNLKKNDTATFLNINIPNPVEKFFKVDSICSQGCNSVFVLKSLSHDAMIDANRKVFYLSGSSFAGNFEYIEGVGSIFSPAYLDDPLNIVNGGSRGGCVNTKTELICCKKGSQLLYKKNCYLSCDSPKTFVDGILTNELPNPGFFIIPNPASEEISITNPANQEEVIKLFDCIGRIVVENNVKPYQTIRINVSDLLRGVYYFRFTNYAPQKLILK